MISIRPAKMEDVKALNELIALSASELSRGDYSEEEIKAAIQYVFGVDTELVKDKTYYIIEKYDIEKNRYEMAGCGGWSKRKTLFGGNQYSSREEGSLLDSTKDAAKIRAFFIHPKCARLGLGSLLLKYCEQKISQNGFAEVEMMATLPGVKLYKTLGYQLVSDEIVELPNQVSLKFVRMKKDIRKLTDSRFLEKYMAATSREVFGLFQSKEESKEAKESVLRAKL